MTSTLVSTSEPASAPVAFTPALDYRPHRLARPTQHASAAWAEAWLRPCLDGHDARTRRAALRVGLWWPLCTPNAEDGRLLVVSKWWQLAALVSRAFLDDPAWSTSKGGLRETVRALRSVTYGDAPTPDFALGQALDHIWAEIRATTDFRLRRQMIDGVNAGLVGLAEEVRSRNTGTAPDLDTYLEIRRLSLHHQAMYPMLAYGLGVDLSPVLSVCPDALDAVHRHASYSSIYVQDLMAHRQEPANRTSWNAVACLRTHQGRSAADAVAACRDMVAYHRHEFLEARQALLDSTLGQRDDVRRYLHEVEHMLAGGERYEASGWATTAFHRRTTLVHRIGRSPRTAGGGRGGYPDPA